MKAHLGEADDSSRWQCEVKWDGYRAIAFCDRGLRLQGRRLNDITPSFPELNELGQDKSARGTILDGELVVFDDLGHPDFQLMQSRTERHLKSTFLIFDLLWAGGVDLRDQPYEARREKLESLRIEGKRWSVPDRLAGEPSEVLAATSDLGLEGIVAKQLDSPYLEGKRSRHWIKMKNSRRQEFVVGGWLPGKGHRSGTLGSLLLGYYEPGTARLRFAGRVGTGFDDQLLSRITADLEEKSQLESPFDTADRASIPANARWARPECAIEVRFTQWTHDGRVRNPVFLGFRPDKTPAEVVREERP
jgi:bifunctional non-homologous end joining protein LigD